MADLRRLGLMRWDKLNLPGAACKFVQIVRNLLTPQALNNWRLDAEPVLVPAFALEQRAKRQRAKAAARIRPLLLAGLRGLAIFHGCPFPDTGS